VPPSLSLALSPTVAFSFKSSTEIRSSGAGCCLFQASRTPVIFAHFSCSVLGVALNLPPTHGCKSISGQGLGSGLGLECTTATASPQTSIVVPQMEQKTQESPTITIEFIVLRESTASQGLAACSCLMQPLRIRASVDETTPLETGKNAFLQQVNLSNASFYKQYQDEPLSDKQAASLTPRPALEIALHQTPKQLGLKCGCQIYVFEQKFKEKLLALAEECVFISLSLIPQCSCVVQNIFLKVARDAPLTVLADMLRAEVGLEEKHYGACVCV